MQFNTLGSTGIKVSALAFGAGPIPALMTSDDQRSQQETLRRALDASINWIDTAATYGDGRSEAGLGRALRNLGALDDFHIATKVRLAAEDLDDIEAKVRRSVAESCQRLGVSRITLLQLHNSITARRGDEPTSVTPEDVLGKGVLGKGSVLSAFRKLQDEGVVAHIGLTAIGHAESLREVIGSGQFATIQVPYNLLNRSAGDAISGAFHETDYGNVIADCARQAMGVFAIRVLAGGALASQPPSPYTFKTKFFPLDLYRRDQRRAGQLAELLGPGANLREHAVRLVLSHPDISSAIIGFGHASHVDEALACLQAGPLPAEVMKQLASFNSRAVASGVSG
jgi:aryl-alcohol dehydrogenase-like predicted oxidoreductase